MAELTQELVVAITKYLTEFGYPLDQQYVKEEAQRLIDGGEIRGGPSLFIKTFLFKAGLVESDR